jgi:Na+-driven multidrug efflux pump
MLRQCIALIPCILIFGKIWGLWGVIAAAPVADAFSYLVTGTLIFFELKKLNKARHGLENPSIKKA